MLIEFAVSNFKSIKDEARLSLVANSAKEHRATHLITPKQAGSARAMPLLRSAVLYGANAAGKSNLLQALHCMQQFVLASHHTHNKPHATPFKFDPGCKMRPTTFEVICLVDGIRHQYGFSVTDGTITSEWLYAWPHGRVQVWFERNQKTWKLGGKLSGDKKVWRRATRADALFLSTAVSLNSAQLQPISDWFAKTLRILHKTHMMRHTPMMESVRSDAKTDIVKFLKSADLAISDFRVSLEDPEPVVFSTTSSPLSDETPENDAFNLKIVRWWLSHDAGQDPAELELDEESDGTRKIFALAIPWLDALKGGRVLVIDELHEHLHPGLVRFLVNQFHDPGINRHDAQLVFSTHDTSIFAQEVFRRDQIWFCERNERQETQLFPLTDFHPRKGLENLERAYLSGRYGALPYVQSELHSLRA